MSDLLLPWIFEHMWCQLHVIPLLSGFSRCVLLGKALLAERGARCVDVNLVVCTSQCYGYARALAPDRFVCSVQ